MEVITLVVKSFGALVSRQFLSLVGLGSGRKDTTEIGRYAFWLCICHWFLILGCTFSLFITLVMWDGEGEKATVRKTGENSLP